MANFRTTIRHGFGVIRPYLVYRTLNVSYAQRKTDLRQPEVENCNMLKTLRQWFMTAHPRLSQEFTEFHVVDLYLDLDLLYTCYGIFQGGLKGNLFTFK